VGYLDISIIVVIVIGVIIIVGGPIIGHIASKASHKAEKEEADKSKANK
jgi:multisubunit Na+/H+ antiporter MnhG subunit